jgi:hypothetical protein
MYFYSIVRTDYAVLPEENAFHDTIDEQVFDIRPALLPIMTIVNGVAVLRQCR